MEGDTLETLAIKSVGKYKVSVKVDEKTLSRIVTAPLKVEKTTSLKPGVREISRKNSSDAATNLAKPVQRFDARGRALKTQSSFQKVYIKR